MPNIAPKLQIITECHSSFILIQKIVRAAAVMPLMMINADKNNINKQLTTVMPLMMFHLRITLIKY